MRNLISIIETAQEARSAEDLKDYDGEALKDGCTKCVPDEIVFADFAYVWWVGGSADEMAAKRAAFTEAEKKIKRETVQHRDMTTGQQCVNPEKVQSLIDNPTSKRPVIHRWNGYSILFDGNHRVTADVLRGETETECLVVDLNDYFDEDGRLKA